MRTYPVALLAGTLLSCQQTPEPLPETTVDLRDGWKIASSAEVAAPGSEISSPGFDAAAWTSATVPTTVLAALVADGEYQAPYFADNLERIPADRFAVPWWYRTEFPVGQEPSGGSPLPEAARLVFEGLNYSADVWLNGTQVGSRDPQPGQPHHNQVAGAFRVFELDVAPYLVAGVNVLAIEVHPPKPGDPTIGFVDWNPTAPDRNMGLWRGVKLRLTGAVAVDHVVVTSELDLDRPEGVQASLKVAATLANSSGRAVTAVLTGTIAHKGAEVSGGDGEDQAIEIEHQVVLEPGEQREIVLSSAELPQLVLDQPRLWWPHDLGEPNLYTLSLNARVDGEVSDWQAPTFGIRQVEDYMTADGHRGYAVNGKKVLIRGGGWVDDMMLADDDRRIEDQIRYVKHLNLNTIRLEGFWGSSHKLFDLADRYGILVMVGWSCQWEWEEYLGGPVDKFGGIDTPAEQELVASSLRDQVVWLRNHPSVFVWVLASDMLPRPELERRYLAQLAEVDPTRPALAACAVATSEVSGPTGVKMNGPYDYVPPGYWYLDSERGGAFGFNTETGPGPQPPPVESIRRMLPEASWWPIDELWDYHCGRHEFNTLDRYRQALEARYGEVSGLEDFARKAQVANYEAMRAMFEAFSIRRPATTGIIQWMLNSAWPEMYWQLYDHYLVPNGAYFGARVANQPIHIAYDYADRGVVVVNDSASPLAGVRAEVRVLGSGSEILFEESAPLEVAAGSRHKVLSLPEIQADDKLYFVDCRIVSSEGTRLASNFYWLSTEEDVLDWPASEWFYTPVSRFADLTALARLPAVAIEVEHRFEPPVGEPAAGGSAAGGRAIHVTLSNPSDRLAFFIELKVIGSESGRLAAPILWDDNYVSLLPGEVREIRGTFPAHALPGEEPIFHYRAFNAESAG